MRILHVEIKNYRSCLETRFDLPMNIMTLIGANGVGKSNILYGLQLFTKIERNSLFFIDATNEGLLCTNIYLVAEFEKKVLFIRSTFYYETDERNIDDVFHTEVKYRIKGENSRKWNYISNEIFDLIEFYKIRMIKEVPKKFQSETINFEYRLIKNLTNLSYYSATQFSDPSKCPISLELDDFRISYRSRSNPIHQQFIYDLYSAYKFENQSFSLFFSTVGGTGLGLIEDIKFSEHTIPSSSYKVKTGGQIQKIENKKSIIIPSITIDGLTLSPNQLSEGTFKTLALVFYILNDKSEFLLIEEPEVCVHHGLLRSILQLIKQQSSVMLIMK